MTDSIDLSGIGRVSGDSFKFEKIGDKIVGTITAVQPPFDRENKFTGRMEKVYPIGITPDGGTQYLIWPVAHDKGPSPMLEAILKALDDAGVKPPVYTIGAKLAVAFTSELDVGKGNPLKMFTAQYKPPAPAPASVAVTDDLF